MDAFWSYLSAAREGFSFAIIDSGLKSGTKTTFRLSSEPLGVLGRQVFISASISELLWVTRNEFALSRTTAIDNHLCASAITGFSKAGLPSGKVRKF